MIGFSCRTILLALVASNLVHGFTAPQLQCQRRSTSLQSDDTPKDSDRAHIERNLEEAMNNDWRMFRAKLVAQENQKATRSNRRRVSYSTTTAAAAGYNPNSNNNEAVPRPAPVQRSTKYQRNWHSSKRENEFESESIPLIPQPGNSYQRNWHSHRLNDNYHDPNDAWNANISPPELSPEAGIFSGHVVGGRAQHMPNPTFGRDRQNKYRNDRHVDLKMKVTSEDPFVSEDELPLFLPETVIDKHRWAHEIPTIEPGAVLLSGERLGGMFHQTVVLITEHSETDGTFGIVINRYVHPLPSSSTEEFILLVLTTDNCAPYSHTDLWTSRL